MTLSDESLEKIKSGLDGYGGELKSLGGALEGLVRFSILLSDYQHDPTSAEKVVGLMRQYTPVFEPLWERIVKALASVGITSPPQGNQSVECAPSRQSAHPEPHG